MGIKRNSILLGKVLLLLVVLLGGLTTYGCVGIKSTPEGGSGGTIADGTLYLTTPSVSSGGFGCAASPATSKLVALDISDGSRLWEVSLETSRSAGDYSSFISSAQRLPNGNTLITEGSSGRIFEIAQQHEIVWEYISPYYGKQIKANLVYRAYRVPYEWVPQEERQDGKAVHRPDNSKFRVPKAPRDKVFEVTKIKKGRPSAPQSQVCVTLPEEQ